MKAYTVTWVVDEEADSPEAAARHAREMQLAPDSIADVFYVSHSDGSSIDGKDSVLIDLSKLDGRPI